MRQTLEKWISDADAIRLLRSFEANRVTLNLSEIQARADEYYIALVGELFESLKTGDRAPEELSRLGNAFSQFCDTQNGASAMNEGISIHRAATFAAAAYYSGGFPASAYVSLKPFTPEQAHPEEYRACFDLLVRPARLFSQTATEIKTSLINGNVEEIERLAQVQTSRTTEALMRGPEEYIASRLTEALLNRFCTSNIRTVLPQGESEFWNPLASSFVNRSPAIWEFFPSQIEAIDKGLLDSPESYSIQMPTGAGKTALCETLLFWHATRAPEEVAIFLVPYRSLATELRATLVKRLNIMGIASRCAYASTIPAPDEVSALEATRVMVATPEALSGLLSADRDFFNRVSLVICDEGHLLDNGNRGINLELLLARFRSRESSAPRFVFMSAIVPNIEEINTWLGGTPESVVKSNYRPAIAEYALLRPTGKGAQQAIDLIMHPHLKQPARFSMKNILSSTDFAYRNEKTNRINTYTHTSIKTHAVAIARKALPLGTSAVFAANKSGAAGAIGLAEELLNQLEHDLNLPSPNNCINEQEVKKVIEYVLNEYGEDWICCQALKAGFVLHHGDIPQETREAFEHLLRSKYIQFVVCTSTLAEGVNLPIHTLVIYSARRKLPDGQSVNLLTRDIKNLVGRAGRPGSTTHGLVVCANPNDWRLIHRVARQITEEPVYGALYALTVRLCKALQKPGATLSNEGLEGTELLRTLIDGIDSALVDLAIEEIGQQEFEQIAKSVAQDTFAYNRLDDDLKETLEDVFSLRAQKIASVRSEGRLGWIKATGAKVRLIDIVQESLLPQIDDWSSQATVISARDAETILTWAFDLDEVQRSLRDAYQIEDARTDQVKHQFITMVTSWLAGLNWKTISVVSGLDINTALRVYSSAIAYSLQVNIEQSVALVGKLLEEKGILISNAFEAFSKQLRFGTQSVSGYILAEAGVRHRSAYVSLGKRIDAFAAAIDPSQVLESAYELLLNPDEGFETTLGTLVYDYTIKEIEQKLSWKH